MRITVFNHLTLDGVMQSPAGSDEDTRDGFDRGGWAAGDSDEAMEQKIGESMGRSDGLLLGRRTYEHLLGYWNTQPDSPFTPVLNNSPKYVATTTLRDPMPWPNSTPLTGNVPHAVADLKQQGGGNLTVLGSGELLHSLLAHDLVDEYTLLVHPVVVGSGRRLFTDKGTYAALELVDSLTTTTGVVIATYRPVRAS
jgi:dihydrofolate reductase